MTKMEKELIEKLERTCQTEARVTLRLIRKLQEENNKCQKVIDLLYNLFYEYISIRVMSGIKFLNDKGFSKCKNCEIELKDENSISCKECIKQQIFKKVEEEK